MRRTVKLDEWLAKAVDGTGVLPEPGGPGGKRLSWADHAEGLSLTQVNIVSPLPASAYFLSPSPNKTNRFDINASPSSEDGDSEKYGTSLHSPALNGGTLSFGSTLRRVAEPADDDEVDDDERDDNNRAGRGVAVTPHRPRQLATAQYAYEADDGPEGMDAYLALAADREAAFDDDVDDGLEGAASRDDDDGADRRSDDDAAYSSTLNGFAGSGSMRGSIRKIGATPTSDWTNGSIVGSKRIRGGPGGAVAVGFSQPHSAAAPGQLQQHSALDRAQQWLDRHGREPPRSFSSVGAAPPLTPASSSASLVVPRLSDPSEAARIAQGMISKAAPAPVPPSTAKGGAGARPSSNGDTTPPSAFSAVQPRGRPVASSSSTASATSGMPGQVGGPVRATAAALRPEQRQMLASSAAYQAQPPTLPGAASSSSRRPGSRTPSPAPSLGGSIVSASTGSMVSSSLNGTRGSLTRGGDGGGAAAAASTRQPVAQQRRASPSPSVPLLGSTGRLQADSSSSSSAAAAVRRPSPSPAAPAAPSMNSSLRRPAPAPLPAPPPAPLSRSNSSSSLPLSSSLRASTPSPAPNQHHHSSSGSSSSSSLVAAPKSATVPLPSEVMGGPADRASAGGGASFDLGDGHDGNDYDDADDSQVWISSSTASDGTATPRVTHGRAGARGRPVASGNKAVVASVPSSSNRPARAGTGSGIDGRVSPTPTPSTGGGGRQTSSTSASRSPSPILAASPAQPPPRQQQHQHVPAHPTSYAKRALQAAAIHGTISGTGSIRSGIAIVPNLAQSSSLASSIVPGTSSSVPGRRPPSPLTPYAYTTASSRHTGPPSSSSGIKPPVVPPRQPSPAPSQAATHQQRPGASAAAGNGPATVQSSTPAATIAISKHTPSGGTSSRLTPLRADERQPQQHLQPSSSLSSTARVDASASADDKRRVVQAVTETVRRVAEWRGADARQQQQQQLQQQAIEDRPAADRASTVRLRSASGASHVPDSAAVTVTRASAAASSLPPSPASQRSNHHSLVHHQPRMPKPTIPTAVASSDVYSAVAATATNARPSSSAKTGARPAVAGVLQPPRLNASATLRPAVPAPSALAYSHLPPPTTDLDASSIHGGGDGSSANVSMASQATTASLSGVAHQLSFSGAAPASAAFETAPSAVVGLAIGEDDHSGYDGTSNGPVALSSAAPPTETAFARALAQASAGITAIASTGGSRNSSFTADGATYSDLHNRSRRRKERSSSPTPVSPSMAIAAVVDRQGAQDELSVSSVLAPPTVTYAATGSLPVHVSALLPLLATPLDRDTAAAVAGAEAAVEEEIHPAAATDDHDGAAPASPMSASSVPLPPTVPYSPSPYVAFTIARPQVKWVRPLHAPSGQQTDRKQSSNQQQSHPVQTVTSSATAAVVDMRVPDLSPSKQERGDDGDVDVSADMMLVAEASATTSAAATPDAADAASLNVATRPIHASPTSKFALRGFLTAKSPPDRESGSSKQRHGSPARVPVVVAQQQERQGQNHTDAATGSVAGASMPASSPSAAAAAAAAGLAHLLAGSAPVIVSDDNHYESVFAVRPVVKPLSTAVSAPTLAVLAAVPPAPPSPPPPVVQLQESPPPAPVRSPSFQQLTDASPPSIKVKPQIFSSDRTLGLEKAAARSRATRIADGDDDGAAAAEGGDNTEAMLQALVSSVTAPRVAASSASAVGSRSTSPVTTKPLPSIGGRTQVATLTKTASVSASGSSGSIFDRLSTAGAGRPSAASVQRRMSASSSNLLAVQQQQAGGSRPSSRPSSRPGSRRQSFEGGSSASTTSAAKPKPTSGKGSVGATVLPSPQPASASGASTGASKPQPQKQNEPVQMAVDMDVVASKLTGLNEPSAPSSSATVAAVPADTTTIAGVLADRRRHPHQYGVAPLSPPADRKQQHQGGGRSISVPPVPQASIDAALAVAAAITGSGDGGGVRSASASRASSRRSSAATTVSTASGGAPLPSSAAIPDSVATVLRSKATAVGMSTAGSKASSAVKTKPAASIDREHASLSTVGPSHAPALAAPASSVAAAAHTRSAAAAASTPVATSKAAVTSSTSSVKPRRPSLTKQSPPASTQPSSVPFPYPLEMRSGKAYALVPVDEVARAAAATASVAAAASSTPSVSSVRPRLSSAPASVSKASVAAPRSLTVGAGIDTGVSEQRYATPASRPRPVSPTKTGPGVGNNAATTMSSSTNRSGSSGIGRGVGSMSSSGHGSIRRGSGTRGFVSSSSSSSTHTSMTASARIARLVNPHVSSGGSHSPPGFSTAAERASATTAMQVGRAVNTSSGSVGRAAAAPSSSSSLPHTQPAAPAQQPPGSPTTRLVSRLLAALAGQSGVPSISGRAGPVRAAHPSFGR